MWSGRQAEGLGLVGRVEADDLQRLLEGRDPTTGTPLGHPLVDRTTANGSTVRAVAGFDATFSAPKTVSVWWALTGDPGLLEAHDVAVAAALEHLERFGATTRVRADGRRLHLDRVGRNTYDNLNRLELNGIQGLVDALDTWHAWAGSSPGGGRRATTAAATITDASPPGSYPPALRTWTTAAGFQLRLVFERAEPSGDASADGTEFEPVELTGTTRVWAARQITAAGRLTP